LLQTLTTIYNDRYGTAHTPCGVNSLRKSNQIKSNDRYGTAHTPCGVNSLRKSNQIKSNQTIAMALGVVKQD
jgi:hypothetical protein